MEFARVWLVGTLVLLHLACRPSLQVAVPPPLRNPGPPWSADLSMEIPDLGPCTDQRDRRLHLDSRRPVTVLVHGCRGSAGRYQALAQVFAFHGQQAIGFSYDDRDGLMVSSGRLARALEALAARMGNQEITVIGHSQGGLIAHKALVADRPDPMRGNDLRLRLVTISAPFSGIAASRHCGSPVARAVSLGLVAPICWMVTGAKWRDITYTSPFILRPGTLLPQVQSFLKINTDERNTCRRSAPNGRCLESDQVFSLEEQRQSVMDATPRIKNMTVPAGHVEIVGDAQVIPTKLIAILQGEGVLAATEPQHRAALSALLARLYNAQAPWPGTPCTTIL